MEIMQRRSFLVAAMAALPLALAAESTPQSSSGTGALPPSAVDAHLVRDGEARNAEHHTIGVSSTDYKVLTADTRGDLFIFQHANQKKGGPPRHLHHHEDEYFYVLDGEYIVELDGKRFNLKQGDSVLGPRGVPHAWAFAGERPGRLLIAFAPANKMEAFFRAMENHHKAGEYANDAASYAAFGMQLLGPHIQI
jgi:mannose-6-phosphate isomerase-like protein (cupin superfamily)